MLMIKVEKTYKQQYVRFERITYGENFRKYVYELFYKIIPVCFDQKKK